MTPSPIFPDMADDIEEAMASMESSQREQTKLKQDCLHRDGRRCVYSGIFDMTSVKEKKITMPQGGRWDFTECAHIIPFALGNSDDTNATETANKAIIWWTLYRYFPTLRGKIDSATINQRENAVIMSLQVRRTFGAFILRFWPREDVQV